MNKEKEENYEISDDSFQFASVQDKEQSVKNMFVPVKPKEPKEDD